MTTATIRRPATWTTFGVLHIVFGSLFLLLSVISLLMTRFQDRENDPMQTIMNASRGYQSFNTIAVPLAMVAASVQILAGVGLLRFRPWGRRWSHRFAGYALLHVTVETVVMGVCVVSPLLAQVPTLTAQRQFSAWFMLVFFGIVQFLSFAYPMLALIVLRRDPFNATATALESATAHDPTNPYQPPRH